MIGMFFNQNSTVKNYAQRLNLLNALALSYHYYTDPDALLAENGFGIIMSLMNICAMSEEGSDWLDLFSHFTSSAHLGGVVAFVAGGSTQLPLPANIYQATLNLVNLLVVSSIPGDKTEDVRPASLNNK